MWINNLFQRSSKKSTTTLFDEAFLRRLERLSFRTTPSLRGEIGGERRSRFLRPALDFSDHRPYTHGDDLRHVDWNAYSRHEELVVKLGEAAQSVNVHILLDASPSMTWSPFQPVHGGSNSGRPDKWTAARRLAGAMGYLGLSGGERLELAPFGQIKASNFGPVQGKRQVVRMLQYLTQLEPGQRGASEQQYELVDNLAGYARRHPRGGLMIIISDLLDTAGSPDRLGEWRSLTEALRFFPAPRWQVMVLHFLTQQEVDPVFEGDYDLLDAETGQSLPFHLDNTTLAQYRLRVKAWSSQVQTAAARRGAVYARVLAEWPLEKAVIPYLRQRGAVQ
jgi:uncharacterized protein (DUF58 family)